MNSFAMLFPGQGAQYINMLSSFFKKKILFLKKYLMKHQNVLIITY